MPETADLSGVISPLLTPTDAADRVDEIDRFLAEPLGRQG